MQLQINYVRWWMVRSKSHNQHGSWDFFQKKVNRAGCGGQIPVFLALGRLRQEDIEFGASLGYPLGPHFKRIKSGKI